MIIITYFDIEINVNIDKNKAECYDRAKYYTDKVRGVMLGEKKDDKYSFVGNNAYSRFFGFSLKTLPTEKAYQK